MQSSSRTRRALRIAVVLVIGVAVALPIGLGVPQLAVLGGIVGVLMLMLARLDSDGTQSSRGGTHLVLLGGLGLVSYACFGIGIPNVITVYFSTVIVLSASHTLGARAAAAWSVPCLLLIAAASLAPPKQAFELDVASSFLTRAATLLTVLAFSVSFRLHQDRQAIELERLALTDALTGLANRRQMERSLEEAVRRAERFGRICATVFIDVDGLKRVNDERGHDAGDALISAVAQRIAEGTRRVDTVSRLGGDEFVVVLSEVRDDASVEGYARSMLERVCRPLELEGGALTPSISVGTATYPSAAGSAKALLSLADAAMYAAKQAGGGCLFAHDGTSALDRN